MRFIALNLLHRSEDGGASDHVYALDGEVDEVAAFEFPVSGLRGEFSGIFSV